MAASGETSTSIAAASGASATSVAFCCIECSSMAVSALMSHIGHLHEELRVHMALGRKARQTVDLLKVCALPRPLSKTVRKKKVVCVLR